MGSVNNFLIFVAFEAHFPSLLQISPPLSEYQEKLSGDYRLNKSGDDFVDSFAKGAFWDLQDEDEGDVIHIHVDTFTFRQTKYISFSHFKEKVKNALISFFETYDIKRVDGVKLRYMNDIPLDDGVVRLKEWIHSPYRNEVLDNNQVQYTSRLRYDVEGTSVDRFDVLGRKKEEDMFRYVIDIRVSAHEKTEIGHLMEKLETLHTIAISQFHQSIKRKFGEDILKQDIDR